MNDSNTPTPNKTPFRRLGLARSIKKAELLNKSDTQITHNSVSSSTGNHVLLDSHSSPLTHPMRTFRAISTDNSSCPSDINHITTPGTPVNFETSSKKTRLSLSQSWKNKITQKRQLHTLKRRKLLDTVDKYSEPDNADSLVNSESNICSTTEHAVNASASKSDSYSGLKTTDDQGLVSEPTSKTKQRIQEIKESITVWRAGCVAALIDLQERRGTGNMESLLNMLQIPLEIVNFDRETQEFLEPD